MVNLKYKIISGTLVIVIVAMIVLMFKQCSQHKKDIQTYVDLSDTLTTYRNKYNQEVVRISVIEFERKKDFLKLKTNDSTIKALQSLVKVYEKKIKDGGSAAIIHTETVYHDTTLIYMKNDTAYFKDENEWITLEGQIIKNDTDDEQDILSYYLLVNNPFTLVYGTENGKDFAEFKSDNIYTTTKILRVYLNKPKKKRFVVSTGLGAAAGVNPFNGKFNVTVGVTASLGIKLFEF